MAALITGGSLIQGSIKGAATGHGNLEAVIGRGRSEGQLEIQHYWRDQSQLYWKQGRIVTGDAIGPAALTQRASGVTPGNFEVVVPERSVGQVGLAHYWLDNSGAGDGRWTRDPEWAAADADGPGAVMENRLNGNLDVVCLHGARLIHHWFDRSAWWQGATITEQATGAPTLFQSSFDDHLEVVVAEGADLVLYWLDGFGSNGAWRPGGLLTNAGDGPHGAVQGRYGVDPHRNFELLVPRGDAAVSYWRDNSSVDLPNRRAGTATWGAGKLEAVALCSTTIDDGWLQALTQEDTSIYHLFRRGLDGGFGWMRSACVRLDDHTEFDDANVPRSCKLRQVTGDRDIQTPKEDSLSTSVTTSGINGTDLGVTVQHAGRHFTLFGDTHWLDITRRTLDSIAEVRGAGGTGLPHFELHGSPLKIVGGAVTQTEYDVPLDAFSLAAQMFTFFSSNHSGLSSDYSHSLDHSTDGNVMGKCVLTRAIDPDLPVSGQTRDRPLQFQLLTTLSSYRFINVSVQLANAATIPGLGHEGHVVLIWGSGAYRADDLRLAYLDLRDPAVWPYLLDNQPFDVSVLGLRYFTGMCGQTPLWSAYESEARPLFAPSALGELSVRWVPQLHRYVLLTMSGPEDPIGPKVLLRTAPAPWGPWSNRRVVFDWALDGLGDRPGSKPFIHRKGSTDGLGDCIFTEQCQDNGAAYAPYLFDVTAGQPGHLTLRYLLSTWNPYQVMLMAHDIPDDLR